MNFEPLIEAKDPAVFKIETQTSPNDKTTLLLIQCFMRAIRPGYCYLEIGSHLGGSLLPHLADSRCDWAISIDPRPSSLPDERGPDFEYHDNSTARMIALLREHLPAADLAKLQTFDLDASQVPRVDIRRKVDLAFIDGEHTNVACFSDFLSIFPTLSEDALIVFHDAELIPAAILNAERFLAYLGVAFRTVFLPDRVVAIGLRGMAETMGDGMGGPVLDREAFLASARKEIAGSIATDVLVRGEIGMRRLLRQFRVQLVQRVTGSPGGHRR